MQGVMQRNKETTRLKRGRDDKMPHDKEMQRNDATTKQTMRA
jgi:hypothetical protein